MSQLKGGDQDAASVVFYRFRDRLIALARSRLDTRIRRREDPEDVVLSAYRSFFRRHAAGSYDFTGWDELWSLLTVITVSKSINRAEYHLARRRTVAREDDGGSNEDVTDRLEQLVDREPTPLEAAILEETVESCARAQAAVSPDRRTQPAGLHHRGDRPPDRLRRDHRAASEAMDPATAAQDGVRNLGRALMAGGPSRRPWLSPHFEGLPCQSPSKICRA